MLELRSTDVRKQWSSVIDNVIRKKPVFIKRTRDSVFLTNIDTMNDILSVYKFNAIKFLEHDNSVTLASKELDIAVNASNEYEAIELLAKDILEYAIEFYENFEQYSNTPNRRKHIPYILKALILNNIEKIKENIILCLNGRI